MTQVPSTTNFSQTARVGVVEVVMIIGNPRG
jgi:hypothetical protein